ncbi:MAG: LamG-like jellyroll fold domain-containing protein, partial [Planctomycetota bacterium]
ELAELEPVLQKTIKDNPNAPTKSGQKDLSELLAASIYESLDLDITAVNGTYTLQLLLHEGYQTDRSADIVILLHEGYQTDRSADIVIEGKKVVENYNFWDKQGKTFDHASVLEYTFTLTDGNIDIEFKEYNAGTHLGGLILSKSHGKPGVSERIVKSPADLDFKDVIKAINFGHTKTLNIDGVEFVAAAVNTTVNGVTNKAVSAVYPGQYGQHIPKMELNRENSPFGDVYIAIRRVKRKAIFKDPDGLLAHWKLDDKEPDQRVVDSSGNKFHAICSSQTSAASVSGKIGRAFRFPEAGGIFFNHPPAEVTKLTDFTLSFWYQPSSDCWQFHQRVFAFGGSGYRMEIDKGAVNIQWREGNVSRRVSTPVLKWKAGQWYHLVFVNNSKTGKTILRSNDLAWAMDPNTFAPAQVSASIKQIELGCRNSVRGTCAFLGCIDDFLHYNSPPPIGNPRAQCMDLGAVDDVRLYERTLSLEEQLAIYDSAQIDPQEAGRSEALAALKRRISTVSVSPYRYFQEKVKPKLSGMELEIKSEWLFQAENEELGSRIKKEITCHLDLGTA